MCTINTALQTTGNTLCFLLCFLPNDTLKTRSFYSATSQRPVASENTSVTLSFPLSRTTGSLIHDDKFFLEVFSKKSESNKKI